MEVIVRPQDRALCASITCITSSGFRGFTVSLVVARPSTVDSLIGTAVHAGARTLKPAKKNFWGYGGVVPAPDGAIWKVATSAKKNTELATREVSDVVLLIGVDDVKASKQFDVARGLAVGGCSASPSTPGRTCPVAHQRIDSRRGARAWEWSEMMISARAGWGQGPLDED
jgi:hypothetical protein